jgi:hypothetical protein
MIDLILERALKEIDRTDMLNEQFSEEEIFDILTKNPKKEKELMKNKKYAKIIKRLKEGGLI